MKRVRIDVVPRGTTDSLGRLSHDLVYTNLQGHKRVAMFFADPKDSVARLRHNMAEQFWFDRMRIRLAREARADREAQQALAEQEQARQ
jgi:hypothetical protein